jgi:transketolase
VEHAAALRAIPNLWFVRPGDANETSAAWGLAVERSGGPVALALSRQKLPTLPGTDTLAEEGVLRGGYILRRASTEPDDEPGLILIATGSELHLAWGAAERLDADGIPTRVVSLPCWEAFELQSDTYREGVLPPGVRRRLTMEAAASFGWDRYAGDEGAIMAIDHFGASAPGAEVLKAFGFTVDRVAEMGRAVARDGLRGRIPTLDPGHQPAGLSAGLRQPQGVR